MFSEFSVGVSNCFSPSFASPHMDQFLAAVEACRKEVAEMEARKAVLKQEIAQLEAERECFSPTIAKNQQAAAQLVRLNVGGVLYTTTRTTLTGFEVAKY